jgi:hypothetical protein
VDWGLLNTIGLAVACAVTIIYLIRNPEEQ